MLEFRLYYTRHNPMTRVNIICNLTSKAFFITVRMYLMQCSYIIKKINVSNWGQTIGEDWNILENSSKTRIGICLVLSAYEIQRLMEKGEF